MRELQFIDYGGLSRLDWFGVSREELFPEEAEEEQRLKGRFRKFKDIDEISDEDVDYRPDFEHWIPELALDDEFEINDLADRFGDVEHDEPTLVNDIIQPEEKEDKKLSASNFAPFSKNKIKRKTHNRKYGKRGRKKSFNMHIYTGEKVKKTKTHALDRSRMLKAKINFLSL